MKNYLACDNICNLVSLDYPNCFHKEWQTMLGLHVSVGDITRAVNN